MLNSGLFAILLSGAAGGALVLHAARAYQGESGWGFALVLLIGLGFVAGMIELVWRDRRSVSLRRQCSNLPTHLADRPALEALRTGLSPRLRAEIDALLGGRRGAVEAPTFTGHLVGLLVMLGLLGTFLGFVDTLAGARMVLERSTDIDAIRNGLAAPLSGLTRSFGTSLAGVAASAALGLAAASVRRGEARARGALTHFAAGPLAPFTPAGRQLAALESLGRHGDALPRAADALTSAVARLESLSVDLVEAQRAGARLVATELGGAVRGTTSELSAAAERMAAAVAGAVDAAAATAGARLTTAAEAQFDAWSARFEARAEAQDAELSARLGSVTEALDRNLARVTQAEAARIDALGARLDETIVRMDRATERTAAAEAARTEQLAQRLSASVSAVTEAVVAAGAAEAARATALGDRLAEVVARTTTAVSQASAAEEARSAALAARAVSDAEALQSRLSQVTETVAARLDALVAAVTSGWERLDTESQARAGALGETLGGFREGVLAAQASLAEGATALRAALNALGEGTAGLETAVSARMTEHVAALDQSLAREADRFIAAQAARADEAATVLQRVDAELARHLTALGEGLAAPLAEVARTASAAPQAAAQVVEAAAARWHEAGLRDAARDQALEALLLRLDALAARLDATGELHSRLFTEAMQSGRAAAEAAEARAEARLATLGQQVAVSIERQAERLAELETHFTQAREAGGSALAATLSDHAKHLGEGLDTTGAMVREAAELVRAGGAELSAVAEMFADAVDRYRESSDSWRQTLGGLEDALARGGSGSGDAGQIMGHYLDQTREIFGDTLRFQRELFSELRALRGAAT
jgi:hypothetical protein